MGDVKLNHDRLLIHRLPRGGYAVLTAGINGDLIQALAAFTDIDDALAFIKDEFEPEKAAVEMTESDREAAQQEINKLWSPKEAAAGSIVTADVTAKVCAEKLPPLPERPIYRGVV